MSCMIPEIFERDNDDDNDCEECNDPQSRVGIFLSEHV